MNDSLFSIMLASDVNDLMKVNKYVDDISKSSHFWKLKFIYDGLPIVKEGKTANEWLTEYKKVKQAHDLAWKFINYMKNKKKGYFNRMHIIDHVVKETDLSTLPYKLKKAIAYESELSLFFNVKNNEIIYYIKKDKDNDEEIVIILSNNEFIDYLAMLFYHFPNLDIASDDEVHDFYLSYKDMLNDNKIRNQLPEW